MASVLILTLIDSFDLLSAKLRTSVKEVQDGLTWLAGALARVRLHWGAHEGTVLGVLESPGARRLVATFHPWCEALINGEIRRSGLLREFLAPVQQNRISIKDLAFGSCIVSARYQGAALRFEAGLVINSSSVIENALPLERKRLRGVLPRSLPGREKRQLVIFDRDGNLPSRETLRILLGEASAWLAEQEPHATDLYIEAHDGEERRQLEAFGFQTLCRFFRAETGEREVLLHITRESLREIRGEADRVHESRASWLNASWLPDLAAHRRHLGGASPDWAPGIA